MFLFTFIICASSKVTHFVTVLWACTILPGVGIDLKLSYGAFGGLGSNFGMRECHLSFFQLLVRVNLGGFCWFAPYELHVYCLHSGADAEAHDENGVVPELFIIFHLYQFISSEKVLDGL